MRSYDKFIWHSLKYFKSEKSPNIFFDLMKKCYSHQISSNRFDQILFNITQNLSIFHKIIVLYTMNFHQFCVI